MKVFVATVLVLCLGGVAAAQRAKPAPAPVPPAKPAPPTARPVPPPDDATLVLEFRGQSPARTRTPEQLRADYNKAVRFLLTKASAETSAAPYYRAPFREDLEAVCLRAGRGGAEAERLTLCNVMIAILNEAKPDEAKPDEAKPGKAKPGLPTDLLVTMLGHIGRAEAVPPLAKMLADKDPAVAERACRALACNPTRQAGEELRQALFSAVRDETKIAMIGALGYQGDAASADWLARMLKDDQPAVTTAAAAALGRIASKDAIKALNDIRLVAAPALREAVDDALLASAEGALARGQEPEALETCRKMFENPMDPPKTRVAALRCYITAQGDKALPTILGLINSNDATLSGVAAMLAADIPGEAATKAVCGALAATTAAPRRLALIEMLGTRGDPLARPFIHAMLQKQDMAPTDREAVRLAVIKALGGVGNEEDALFLTRLAGQTLKGKEEERRLARASLRKLRGAKVDSLLISALAETDPAVRLEAIGALGERAAGPAVPRLLALCADADASVRLAALQALTQLADTRSLGGLIHWLMVAKGSSEVAYAEQAATAACTRADDKEAAAATLEEAMKDAPPSVRCALMRLASALGGPKALEILMRGVEDKEESVSEAAIKAMSQSGDQAAAAKLLELAKSAPEPAGRAMALRGYIRLQSYLDQPPDKQIWTFIRIMDLATGVEEKKLAVASLGSMKTLGSMKLAIEQLDNKDVRPEAEAAICRIARHLYDTNANEVTAAMERILSLTENPTTAEQAKRILAQAKPYLKKAGK
jgi:HEAT repeat protein